MVQPVAQYSAHPAAWRSTELFEREDWSVQLTAVHNRELRDAADATRALTLEELTTASFTLPTLGPRLAVVQDRLETGAGAAYLRGLDLTGLDDELSERIFWGLASYIGTAVSQSAYGERLLHVRDEGYGQDDARFRGPFSNRRLSFHSDRCDVIGFLCVQPALSGGSNDIISSAALHDELAQRFPDELETLRQPFAYLRHTVDTGNERPFVQLPVFSECDGHFAASLLRVLIDRADRSPLAPSLTSEQRAALDCLEQVAEDPALYANLQLERGDILLLNNWVTFHRRREFADASEPALCRHIMRLWLAVPNSRPLVADFKQHFGATAAGAVRGGMHPPRRA